MPLAILYRFLDILSHSHTHTLKPNRTTNRSHLQECTEYGWSRRFEKHLFFIMVRKLCLVLGMPIGTWKQKIDGTRLFHPGWEQGLGTYVPYLAACALCTWDQLVLWRRSSVTHPHRSVKTSQLGNTTAWHGTGDGWVCKWKRSRWNRIQRNVLFHVGKYPAMHQSFGPGPELKWTVNKRNFFWAKHFTG